MVVEQFSQTYTKSVAIGENAVFKTDTTGFRSGLLFTVLIAPVFFVPLPLSLAWGWILYISFFAVFFAPKALFWLTIGSYGLLGVVRIQTGGTPSFALLGNSLSLDEVVWASVSMATLFRLLTNRETGYWIWSHGQPSKLVKLALSIILALASIATINTFLYGSEGRWSTAIRFALPLIPLVLTLRSCFYPIDVPELMKQLRLLGVFFLFVGAVMMFLFMSPNLRHVGVFSHLIMIGLTYVWLELLTATPDIRLRQAPRLAILLFGAYVYFVLASGALSDMWMFVWAIALGLLAVGQLYSSPAKSILGTVLILGLLSSVLVLYTSGPARLLTGDATITDVESSTASTVVSLLGDNGRNLADRFVRWHIVLERIKADPFALQFAGYGSEDDLMSAFNIYGYHLSNLVAHNAFLDLALWLSPLAPLLLIFLLWRFWRTMLYTAANAPREIQLLLVTCAIAAPIFWIRDLWGTWIIQGYSGARFSFWLVISLGLLGQLSLRKDK